MKSKLIEVKEKYPQTEIWMDSFHVDDHIYGLTQKITGVTTSPTWISRMMLNEPFDNHKRVIERLYKELPQANEQELTWKWVLEMGKERSKVMLPLWKDGKPKIGRYSVQVSIFEYNNKDRMVKMAEEINACGENMQVKIPATKEGIAAMEEATFRGVSVMATVCFSVDQAIAVAEAFERALKRRLDNGLSNENLYPICAVLLGGQDDWLRQYADSNNIMIHPDALNWGSVAIAKKVYKIYKERGYKTRMLVAYYRQQLHYSEFIGGDVIMTIPSKWQKRFENFDLEIKDYMSIPVDDYKLAELKKLEPFNLAYNEGSLTIDDYNTFPPVVLIIRYFLEEYQKAVVKVRDVMLANPLK